MTFLLINKIIISKIAGHGYSLKGGISKKDSTQGTQWAYFQGFAPPEPLAEFPVAHKKRFAKPLKIRPRSPDSLDAALKRIPVTDYHPSPLSSHDTFFKVISQGAMIAILYIPPLGVLIHFQTSPVLPVGPKGPQVPYIGVSGHLKAYPVFRAGEICPM